jgi:hypothetical protein
MFYHSYDESTGADIYTGQYPSSVIEKIQDALVQALVVLQHSNFESVNPAIKDAQANINAGWILLNLLKDIRSAKNN